MVALVITVLLIMMAGAEGSGRWSKCVGRPSDDGFKVDSGSKYSPAWDPDPNALVRLGKVDASLATCTALFPHYQFKWGERTLGSGQFFYLRKFEDGFKDNGEDYKWVDFKDFHYGSVSCTPVKYDESLPQMFCYLKQAEVTCEGESPKKVDILGGCGEEDAESVATFCEKTFFFRPEYTVNNAKVLCLNKVARREVVITSTDPVIATGYESPELTLTDETSNGGSKDHTWNFEKTFTKKISSSYSDETGWRVKVSATYKSGLLSDAIAKWEASVDAEKRGSYTTSNSIEETKEQKYGKNFVVPPRTKLKVTVNIFSYKLDIPYEAKEKYYDENDKLLGEATVRGIWKGVFTFTGNTQIQETKLDKKDKETAARKSFQKRMQKKQ